MKTLHRWLLVVLAGCMTSEAAPAPGASPPASPQAAPIDGKVAALRPTPLVETTRLDKAIATYFGTVATLRTYIQTDKPLYQPGETVWFRADLRATKTLAGGLPI